MLCRRKIELHGDTPGLPPTLILQEVLADCGQAKKILSRAKAQAHELSIQAAKNLEEFSEKAGLEFWQRANAQLGRWEIERQAICTNLEKHATAVINQAMRQLLDDVEPEQRLAALLKQLLATQIPVVKATLLCHPLERESVEKYLARLGSNAWTLRTDDTLSPQALILETDEGDFRIDWISLCKIFLASEVAQPEK